MYSRGLENLQFSRCVQFCKTEHETIGIGFRTTCLVGKEVHDRRSFCEIPHFLTWSYGISQYGLRQSKSTCHPLHITRKIQDFPEANTRIWEVSHTMLFEASGIYLDSCFGGPLCLDLLPADAECCLSISRVGGKRHNQSDKEYYVRSW